MMARKQRSPALSPDAKSGAICGGRGAPVRARRLRNTTSTPAGSPRAGDLFGLTADHQSIVDLNAFLGIDTAGLREELLQRQRDEEERIVRKAERDRMQAEADAARRVEQKADELRVQEYRQFKDEALAYLYP